MNTNRRGIGEIPFTRIVVLEGLVREYTRWAYFNEVSAEFIFEGPVFMPSKINMVMCTEYTQVIATGIIIIKPDTAVTLNAPVHLMVNKRSQFLVLMGSFFETVTTVIMTGHHGHILQVTFSSFVAHRAVMGMVDHQALNDGGPECHGFRIIHINDQPVGGRFHARHHEPSDLVVGIPVFLYRAQPACSHRSECPMVTKVGHIDPKRKTGLKEIFPRPDLILFSVDLDPYHHDLQGQLLSFICRTKSS
jgi:hypothetical protein